MRRRGILINRDECRSPMPWNAEKHAGFSHAGTPELWLPLHPDSPLINVASQRDDPSSVLSSYRRMLALRRRSPALSGGHLELLPALADPARVLAFSRRHEDELVWVFLNFSAREAMLDLRGVPGGHLVSNMSDEPEAAKSRRVLAPWEAVVVFVAR